MILVVTSGLLIKSLYRLSETGTGFVPSQILAIRISPNPSFCTDRAACIALYDRLLARARDIQGVTDAEIVNALPLDGGQPSIAMDIEGHPKSPEFPSPLFWAGAISPGYVPMMRIPLLSGRNFTNADGVNADRVVLISASTARHFWPGENPIGRHIKSASESSWRTIVGVVGDVRQFELGRAFPDYIPGAMYMPYSQAAQQDGHIFAAMDLMVKIQGHAERIGLEIRALAQDQNPNIPVSRITTLDDVVAGSISDFRATIRVFLCFACVAILLAAIGVYGLVSYWVSQRTFEIGVRMALGATRRRIVSMILAQGMRVALCGTLLGLAAALVATRYVASLLFGVGATDPLTFAAVTALILVVAGMATVFPAWRASQIDPTKSLRVD